MKLFVIDDIGPENIAMVQALYSRSAESVEVHLEKVRKSGSGKFFDNYVVNYNHKSIADCGATTVFIEDVSLLAAKAIQDNPLYSGQETSTRYIDMSKQRIVDPVGTPTSKAILNAWMTFYSENQDRVSGILVRRYPKRLNEKDDTYGRAIKARTFDVLRGFLPAGICTQLSWATNLRQAGDNLTRLTNHPTDEIREIGSQLGTMLNERYPSSGFGRHLAGVSGVSDRDVKANEERAAWEAQVGSEFTYSARLATGGMPMTSWAGARALTAVRENAMLTARETPFSNRYAEILRTRPRGCVLPHFMMDLGQYTFEFPLDFGSFRDIQRQRNGVCRMPLLDTSLGFEPWYLEQLGDPDNGDVGGLRDKAVELICELQKAIGGLDASAADKQYYTAIGFRVPCQVTYALPALLYVLELRSSKTVHPTLRKPTLQIIELMKKSHPDIAIWADTDPDDWTVRRGEQTITAK